MEGGRGEKDMWGDESPPTEYEKWKGKAKHKKRGCVGRRIKGRERRKGRKEKKPKWKVCGGRGNQNRRETGRKEKRKGRRKVMKERRKKEKE